MLFVHDQDGAYRPAPKELVLNEANKLSGYHLRRGTKILSAETAKTVIGYRLRGKQHEVFACLFLDCHLFLELLVFSQLLPATSVYAESISQSSSS